MAVNDKSAMSGQLVVERTADCIGCLRLPVDAARASQRGLLVDVVNEGLANSELAPCGGCEKILQVADQAKSGGAAVKQVMSQADHFFFMFRDYRKNWLDGIEEASPGCLGNFSGQCGSPCPSVESVIAVPEREPLIKVFGLNGSYHDTSYNGTFRHRTDFLGMCQIDIRLPLPVEPALLGPPRPFTTTPSADLSAPSSPLKPSMSLLASKSLPQPRPQSPA